MNAIKILALALPQFLVSNAFADATVTQSQAKDLRLSDFARIIELLGKGRTEAAADAGATLAPPRTTKTKGPFQQVTFKDRFTTIFKRLTALRPNFESAEVIGIESIALNVKKISFIAIGQKGPVLFHFRVFRYGGRYLLGNVGFTLDWVKIESNVATINQRVSKRYVFSKDKTANGAKTPPNLRLR